MSTSSFYSVRAVLERARQYSKTDMERLVEESELKIEEFEMKIESLERQVAALMELRDRERTLVTTLECLLSSIYTMPPELLAEIFQHAIHRDTHIQDVFRVSQVCSDWRQVAHSTPRLWTGPMRVDLDIHINANQPEVTRSGLAVWLARSAVLPIPITLRLWSSNIHQGLLEEVLKTTSRWSSLWLDSPDRAATQLIRRLAEYGLDSLKELDIPFLHPTGDIISFATVPRLRKLSMNIYSSLPIRVPWASLTDLTLRHCAFPDPALDVLALCVALVRVSVRTSGWFGHPKARQNTLALTHLHTLSFALFGTAAHFTPFFNDISAPVLQDLCLQFREVTQHERWTEPDFTVFLGQAPNITQLELQYAHLTSNEFRAVLRRTPSLTHLKLRRCPGFDNAVMSAMLYKDDVTPLVPRLNHLVLKDMTHRVTDDTLATMIATRWWTDAELASASSHSESVLPAVARWTRVELWYDLSKHFLLEDMPSDILIIP